MRCLECSDELVAPEWSEYRNERQVRHLWHCWECDFRFESLVSFPAVTKSMREIKAGNIIYTPSRGARKCGANPSASRMPEY
jgi:hypothetical protein